MASITRDFTVAHLSSTFLVTMIGFGFALAAFNISSNDLHNIDTFAISLTFIEIVLSVLAIILGLGAFGGFWLIRQAAEDSAAKEARRYLDASAKDLFYEVARTQSGQTRETERHSSSNPDIPDGLNQDEVLKGAKEFNDE